MIVDKPLEGVTVDRRLHPAGRAGSLLSLKEVAERGWKARMSPRLRAWVTQQLDACGVSRDSRRKKMQCVLDATRAKVPYIADPVMGEFMATPDQVLCLDHEKGLCIIGCDCDEFTIILIASAMCIGIPAMVIGSSHKHPHDVPTHVFGAFQDEQEDWVKMDGTTKHPVGKVGLHGREWWSSPARKRRTAARETSSGWPAGAKSASAAGARSGGRAPSTSCTRTSGSEAERADSRRRSDRQIHLGSERVETLLFGRRQMEDDPDGLLLVHRFARATYSIFCDRFACPCPRYDGRFATAGHLFLGYTKIRHCPTCIRVVSRVHITNQ